MGAIEFLKALRTKNIEWLILMASQPSVVILYQGVRELRSLYVYIYIQLFRKRFYFANDPSV